MIELRPSDVMKAQLENRNKIFDIATNLIGFVLGKVSEAERVNQVNTGLTALMRSEAQWQESEQTRTYDRQPMAQDTSGLISGGARKVDFGHATEAEIKTAHDKFIREQKEFILAGASHPAARRELSFHIDQQAVTSFQRTQQNWRVVRQHTAIADLDELAATVMQGTLPWEQKVAAIKTRVDAVVRTGDLWPEDGAAYVAKIMQQAQDAYAYAESLAVMRKVGTAEAGIAWLDANTPYYDGNPEKREQMAATVQTKFNNLMAIQQAQQRKTWDANFVTYMGAIDSGKLGGKSISLVNLLADVESPQTDLSRELRVSLRSMIQSKIDDLKRDKEPKDKDPWVNSDPLVVQKIIDARNDPKISDERYKEGVASYVKGGYQGLGRGDFEQYYNKPRPETPISRAVTEIFSKATQGSYPLMSPQDAASTRIALDKEIEAARQAGKPYSDTDIQKRVEALLLPAKMANIKTRLDKAVTGVNTPTPDEQAQYKVWQEVMVDTSKYQAMMKGGAYILKGWEGKLENIEALQSLIDQGKMFGMADNPLLKRHIDVLKVEYGKMFKTWSGMTPEAAITLTAPKYGGRSVYGVRTKDGQDRLFTVRINPKTNDEEWYIFDPKTDTFTFVTDQMKAILFGGKK